MAENKIMVRVGKGQRRRSKVWWSCDCSSVLHFRLATRSSPISTRDINKHQESSTNIDKLQTHQLGPGISTRRYRRRGDRLKHQRWSERDCVEPDKYLLIRFDGPTQRPVKANQQTKPCEPSLTRGNSTSQNLQDLPHQLSRLTFFYYNMSSERPTKPS